MKMVPEYRYHVYADWKNDGNFKIAAWYDDYEKAKKEANFLRSKGYEVKIVKNI